MEKKERRILLLAIGFCLFLAAVDQTIISTALPSILSQIGGLNDVSLIITSYLVASVTFGPIYGKLSDVFGRKNILTFAIICFLIGTVLASLTNTTLQLAGARFIQGIGGGGLFVLAFTIAADLAPPRNRGRIQGLFASVFGLASVSGPLFGGLIIEYLDWRWIFYFKIPFSLCSLIIVLLFFKPEETKKPESFNIPSLICIVILLSSVVFLFSSLSNSSIFNLKNSVFLALIIISSIILYLSERTLSNPVFNLQIKKNNNLKLYLCSAFFTGIVLLSVSAFIQIYLQIAMSFKPLLAGCFLIPLTLGIICASTFTGKLISISGRYKIYPLIGGLLLFIGSLIVVIFVMVDNSHFVILLLALFILGLGLGPQLSVVTAAVQNSIPKKKIGLITGTLTTTRQLGGIIGLSFLSLLFSERVTNFSRLHYSEFIFEENFSLSPGKLDLNNSLDTKILIIESFKTGTIYVFLIMSLLGIVIFLLNSLIKEVNLRDK